MYTVLFVESKDQWESFILSRPEANFLHSWSWGEFQSQLGKKVLRLGIHNDNQLIGMALCVVEDAKRGRYMTIAGGPIVDWDNKELLRAFLLEIKKHAIAEGCVFVRLRPQVLETPETVQLSKDLGLVVSPMHLTADLTTQLNLSESPEILLSKMRKTTRYEVKKAQKENVRIERSTNPEDLKEFYDLQMLTAQRHGFVPFSYTFLYEQFKEFAQYEQVVLFKAYKDEKLLAEAFIIYYGNEASYHYGASTDEGRRYPGAYLIQWEAIQEAKKRGMLRYNFWGVVPLTKTDHRFYGVSVFKRGFGGEDVQYLRAHDLVIQPLRYKITAGFETLRRKLRKLDD